MASPGTPLADCDLLVLLAPVVYGFADAVGRGEVGDVQLTVGMMFG